MTLVFLLEELSAQEMLKGLLPRILPTDIETKYIVFEGKSDLEKRLELKIKGWRTPDSFFIVLRDKDSGNCLEIKRKLVEKCHSAGRPDTLVRIACHELESWYLGDLSAIEKGLNLKLSESQNHRKFRDPDLLSNASQELAKITRNTYQKVSGSRAIAPFLDIASNRSISFTHFISGLKRFYSVSE